MSKDSDYANYLRGQRLKRLERVSLSILTGMAAVSGNYTKGDEQMTKEAIDLAKEFIKQIDEEKNDKSN